MNAENHYEKAARDKDRLLTAVAASIKQLLDERDYYRATARCFEILGQATGVDRVYLFENHYGADGSETTSQKIEWSAQTTTPQLDNPDLQEIPLAAIESFVAPLKNDQAYYGIVRELENDRTRELLEAQSILSVVALPVFVKGQFWGFIGFDECKFERVWTEGEFSTLSAFASTLGRVIERRQVEAELENAKQVAESASVLKSQFLANMSHEIRTPMNGIIGFLELLQRTNLSAEQKEYLREAKSASEILLVLINDILDLSKIEAGKMTIEKISFNLRTAVEDAVAMIVPRANEKKLDLHLHFAPSVPEEISGDPARLRQVINNLVSNAIKFTQKGEITIEVSASPRAGDTMKITFSVSDTGIGISDTAISRLFRPFIQADASTTRKFGGTGLGLAISRELVRLMDGEITVESVLGQGSTFSFYIVAPVTKKIASPSRYLGINNENILILDDNANNRRIVRSYLEEAGCQVFESASPEKAITSILMQAGTADKISLAIIDYQMPGMDGYQFANALQLIPVAQEIKMILLTSTAQTGDAKAAKAAGFCGYLSKPVRRAELLNCLAMVRGLPAATAAEHPLITRYSVSEAEHAAKPRILLAEDNDMNRKIVMSLLAYKKYSCDVAIDGIEAYEAATTRDYDLILMDCQMPGMDGYESTQKIRAFEAGRRHTRIVAMTANAMEGDRQKCLAAGMDDYISKPLDFERFYEILGVASAPRKAAVTQGVDDYLAAFCDSTGLTASVGAELFVTFKNYLPELLDAMAAGLDAADFVKLAQLGHQLKGSSGNLRIIAIAELATALETAAKAQDLAQCRQLFAELRQWQG